jgi:hypothetical protein
VPSASARCSTSSATLSGRSICIRVITPVSLQLPYGNAGRREWLLPACVCLHCCAILDTDLTPQKCSALDEASVGTRKDWDGTQASQAGGDRRQAAACRFDGLISARPTLRARLLVPVSNSRRTHLIHDSPTGNDPTNAIDPVPISSILGHSLPATPIGDEDTDLTFSRRTLLFHAVPGLQPLAD